MPIEESMPSSVADLAALGRLLEEHRPRLLAMLQRRIDPKLNARLDADSILQETFMLARRRWNDFQASAMTAYAWLYRLALDTLIEGWRRETRGPRDVRRVEMRWAERDPIQFGGQVTSPSRTGPAVSGLR